jgi:SprA-related family
MVASVSASPSYVPPAILSSGAAPLPTQTTTTPTQVSPSPVKLTVTQLVGGETLVTAQKVGGSSCLCEKDVQPVPGDPQATVDKLQKVLSEASAPGSSSSTNEKLLAEARSALADAQQKIAAQHQGDADDGAGAKDAGSEPDNASDKGGNQAGNPLVSNYGTHTPQGVSASSVSVFA